METISIPINVGGATGHYSIQMPTVLSMPSIKAALVIRSEKERENLEDLLNRTPGYRCVCACRTIKEAFQQFISSKPDVALVNMELPVYSCITFVRRLVLKYPVVRIIMLAMESSENHLIPFIESGVSGYLPKTISNSRILTAIKEAYQGGYPISDQAARNLVQSFQRSRVSVQNDKILTQRESEVLNLVGRGYSSKDIATSLLIGRHTVETHVRNIFHKLGVRSRAEAVAKCRAVDIVFSPTPPSP